MPDIQERVVRHALFVYTDPDRGSRRVAYRGDTVRVAGEDLERGERLGVFVADGEDLDPVMVPVPTPIEELPSPAGAQSDGDEEGSEPDGDEPEVKRPARTATKDAWVDFAVSKRGEGVSEEAARAEAEAMTKAELAAAFGA